LSTDELIDLVSDDDEVIGTVWRDEAFTRNIVNIRGVNAFVINGAGQLWIPRRSLSKTRWPGAYDMGVAGAVGAGESYEAALFREAQEELNLDLNREPWRQVAYFRPQDTGLSNFQCVYEINLETAPEFNPDDYSGGEWLSPAALVRQLEAGAAAKGDLLKLVRLIYGLDPLA
jgi:isopentenyldiphosphate isomerase